jgi:hypothetical protein
MSKSEKRQLTIQIVSQWQKKRQKRKKGTKENPLGICNAELANVKKSP